MNRIKILRLILSITCIVFLAGGLIPLVPGYVYIPLYSLIFTFGNFVWGNTIAIIFMITGITMLGAILTAAILGFIPRVNKSIVGALAIVGGACALTLEILLMVFLIISWYCYVAVVMTVPILVLGILLLAFKEQSVLDVPESSTPKPQPQYPGARIIGISGMYQGASFNVSDGKPVTFGRDPAVCNIIFDQYESMISRVHCIIVFDRRNNNYRLHDISKNGVFIGNVNNRVVSGVEQVLHRGTVICLGSAKNAFRLD